MKTTSLLKTSLLALTALAIFGAIVYAFLPQPVTVETDTVTFAPMTVTVSEEGKTRVLERYRIAAPISGYAQRIAFDVGDRINKGQTLALLTPLPAPAPDLRDQARAHAHVAAAEEQLKAARSQEEKAQAALEYAQKEHQRVATLVAEHYRPTAELDSAADRLAQAEAEHRAATFAIGVAKYELAAAKTELRYAGAQPSTNHENGKSIAVPSPTDGHILAIHHKSAGPVTVGEALLEVGDTKAIEIIVDVLSADAVRVRPGMTVRLRHWGGEGILDARVRTVEPVGFTKVSALGVEEQRVWVIADLTSPAKDRQTLGDGYRVEAEFLLWQEDNVLQVPISALFRSTGNNQARTTAGNADTTNGWAVFTVKNNTAHLTQVQVGHSNDTTAQVLSGLTAGDTVILHPQRRITEGTQVQPGSQQL